MTKRAKNPEGFLPLSPPVFNVLLALGSGPLHPYGIMQAIDRRTGGKAVILPGTLYTSIARMVKQQLIEETSDRPDPSDDDSRRRYYCLSKLGRMVAIAEAKRLAILLDIAREQRLAPPPIAPAREPGR